MSADADGAARGVGADAPLFDLRDGPSPSAPPDAYAALVAAAAKTREQRWPAASFAALAADPATRWVEALAADGRCDGPRLLGFLTLRTALDEAEILSIARAPAAAGAGLGQALLSRGIASSEALGTVRLFLEVAETNRAARRLYHEFGFEAVGLRPGYFTSMAGDRINAIVLRKSLQPQ